jgi:hypothetical protein
MIRKNYGHFTVVIEISDSIIVEYTKRLRSYNCHFSEALSKTLPHYNDDDNPVYTLPEQFVRGYFDQKTMEKITNPKFDPYYRSPLFEENIKRLISPNPTN